MKSLNIYTGIRDERPILRSLAWHYAPDTQPGMVQNPGSMMLCGPSGPCIVIYAIALPPINIYVTSVFLLPRLHHCNS